MIHGVHAILYSPKAERLRSFFRDVLGYPYADAGHGWQIFALPPAELGIHPCEPGGEHAEVYFMCDDLGATLAELGAKGVTLEGGIQVERWGRLAHIRTPEGDVLALYQPTHPTALGLK